MKFISAKIFALAGIYFLLAQLGLTLATLNHSASPVWPATGFAFAIVYLYGNRALFAVALGAFAANYLTGVPIGAVLGISVGNTAEAFVGAAIIRFVMSFRKHLGDQTDALSFAIAAVLGGVVSATVGVASLLATDSLKAELIGPVWLTWWLGDSLGGLVVAPLLVQMRKFKAREESWFELVAAVGFAVLALYFVFFTSVGGPYLFILFPILLFVVYRSGSGIVFVFSTSICVVSIAATVNGSGPFALGTLNERLVHLQFFLAAYAITALALAGFGRQRISKVSAVALILCWGLSGIIFHSFDASEREKTASHLENLIDDTQEKSLRLLDTYQDVLRGGIGLFAASKNVEANEWKAFSQTVEATKHHHGMNGLGVVWPVAEKDIRKFQTEMIHQGLSPYVIRPYAPVETVPTPAGSDKYVIKFIEPVQENAAALGLDIRSEANRRFAAELARDSGLAAITSKIALVQDEQKSPGVLYFLPIYKNGAKLNSVEERRRAHIGWVYAPIMYQKYFSEVFSQASNEIELEVYEGQTAKAENLVFSNFSKDFGMHGYDRQSNVRIGQRDFVMRFAKSPHFVSSHNTIVAWVGFFSAIASLLLTNLIITVQLVGQRSREIAEDLTVELTESREKFKQGERRLLYALDGSNDGIWDWNIIQAEMYISGKIVETHGWPQRFHASSIDDLSAFAHPDDLARIHRSIKSVMRGELESHEVETRYRTRTGEWRWVLTRGKISERDENGTPTRMTGVHIDIHDLKRTQRLLEEAQYQLKNIASSVPAKVSLWNKDLRCVFANDFFGSWFGKSGEQLVGRFMDDLLGSEEFSQRKQWIEQALKGENVRYEREANRASDGQKRYIVVTYLPNKTDGALDGFFLFIQDITDLKKAELRAIEERQAAIEAANVKSQFLANMSHEIRTPLNGIIGMANLLGGTELTPIQQEYSNVILHSSDALLNLINDILDFSKVEAGKLDLELVNFNLKRLLAEVVQTMSFAASEKGLTIKTDIDFGTKEYFTGDPGRIRQILTNLIGNAIKFTSSGTVTVRVSADEMASESRLKFEIVDTGIGIPREALGRMFQAFSQADASMTRRFGGTGLGLSICKQLVRLMSGTIGVESEAGKGSVFWFEISLAHGEITQEWKITDLVKRTTGARILVVDDIRINQRIAIEMLKSLGYQAHAVGNGIEALSALRESKYDLILMDCQMPEMDGFQATEAIRTSDLRDLKSIPIVAMTGNVETGDKDKCIAAGMDDYISKPLNQSRLVAVVENGLRKERHFIPKAPSISGGHVLIVEDNKVNQKVVGYNLKNLNYTYDVVENGVEALEYLSKRTCDLILMDCQMPEMDGFEATRRIRQLSDARLANIPIVALTANAMKGDREDCLHAGMNDYLAKPIDVKAMTQTLEKWMKKPSSLRDVS